MSSNRRFQLLFFEWPDEEIPGPEPDCFFFLGCVPGVRKNDDRHVRTKPAQPPQDMHAIGLATGQIQQKQVGSGPRLHSLHRFPTATGGFEMPSIGFAYGPEGPEYGR